MLAALGADVLRIDSPYRPELPLHAVDGVIGKVILPALMSPVIAGLVGLGARFVIAGSDIQYLMRAARDLLQSGRCSQRHQAALAENQHVLLPPFDARDELVEIQRGFVG